MMRVEIEGKAKPLERQYGAWLRGDSSPCHRDCPLRGEGCKITCKEHKKWQFKHNMAIEEQKKLMQPRREAGREHRVSIEKAEKRRRARK